MSAQTTQDFYYVTLNAVPGTPMTIKCKNTPTLGKLLKHAVTLDTCNKVIKKGAKTDFAKMRFEINGRQIGLDYVISSVSEITITENYQGNAKRSMFERAVGFLGALVGRNAA